MKMRFWSLVSLVLICAMLLASCASQPAASTEATAKPAGGEAPAQPAASGGAGGENVTIKFFHKWPEPEQTEYYNYVIAEFQKAHPNIKVEMEAVSDEAYKDKIRVLMNSGQVPDVYFSWAGEFSWKFARAGQAMDLTDAFLNSDWKDVVINSAVEPYKWEGKIYGIPMRVNAKFMVYNKEMFEKNGLKPPTTWDELLSTCATLKGAGVIPIAFGNEYPWASSHYVGDFNAKLVDGATRQADYLLTSPADKLFTDPGYVEALARFKALNDNGCFNEGPNGISHSGARSSFIAGKAAMIYIELEEFITVSDGMGKDKFSFFPLPGGTGGKGDQALLTGAPDGFMISAKSAHPAEAIEFLKFLTSKAMGTEYVKRLGIPSSVMGAVNADTALPVVVEGMQAIDKASGMALWLDTDINVKIAEVYLAGMQALMTGSKTPEQVMSEVQAIAREIQAEQQ